MSSFSAGDDEPTRPELAVAGVSVLLTALLFGYVAWHGVTTPDANPEAAVVETELDGDTLLVTVEVTNPGGPGLRSVTVSVDCANESLTFTHVPTEDYRTGTVVCPAGTTDPTATVDGWVTDTRKQ